MHTFSYIDTNEYYVDAIGTEKLPYRSDDSLDQNILQRIILLSNPNMPRIQPLEPLEKRHLTPKKLLCRTWFPTRSQVALSMNLRANLWIQ